MSERGDFFESASKSAKKDKPPPTRADFFSGADIDPAQKVSRTEAEKKALLEKYPDPFKKATDVADAIYQMGSSVLATPIAGLAGMGTAATNALGITDTPAADVIEKVSGALTYQPHTEEGRDVASNIASPDVNPLAVPGALGADWADTATEHGAPPWLATAIRTGPDALVAALGLRGALSRRAVSPGEAPSAPISEPTNAYARAPDGAPLDAQAALNKSASGQSMGAAGAAVDLKTLSQKLRANVEKAVADMGGNLSEEQISAIARYKRAESLPVPVHMTEGQALSDSRLISLERNARGKHEKYTKGFDAQDQALTENLRVMRDESGPDVFSTNATEHADTLIARYKAIDEARNADIGAKYEALRDAAGGAFPVDAPALLANVKAALKKDLATSNAPPDVIRALEEHAASGTMTLEDFEGLRTSLARTQRSASDGQVRHAAGVIRNQIEAMPLQAGAEQLKGLADTARAAARDRFQALEADPAYKAAVNDSTPPDAFVRKFVIGGTRDNVARLSAAMADDATATQTLKVATIEHLRDAARIDRDYKGTFAQKGYNTALNALEPKLGSLLDAKTAETMRELGATAFDIVHRPAGAFVNESNTHVAAAAAHAADALEGALNYKTGGIPIASHIRKQINEAKVVKQAERTFEPGSGLTRLSGLAKLKEPK